MKNEELRMKNFCGNGGQRAHNEGEGGVERLAGWRWYAWSVVILHYQGGDSKAKKESPPAKGQTGTPFIGYT